MIGIRADANKIIATGHVMRCLTIARQLLKMGEEVVFFTADDESRSVIDLYASDITGITAVVLGSSYDNMEEELPLLLNELRSRNVELLLVDFYFVTRKYFSELSKFCKTAYIDDLGKEAYDVDLLINYSGYYEIMDYPALYKDCIKEDRKKTRFLLGLTYAPLREQFFRAEDDPLVNKSQKNPGCNEAGLKVLLASGGSDKFGMLKAVLQKATCEKENLQIKDTDAKKLNRQLEEAICENAVSKRKEKTVKSAGQKELINWEVVVGNMVENVAEIDSFAHRYSNIKVHKNVSDMAGLMRNCDLAVTAAGTMLTECAAVGLPTIFYQVADNQKFNAVFWQNTNGMIFAGSVYEGKNKYEVSSDICASVRELSFNKERLFEMNKCLRKITDGKGAMRISQIILEIKG